MVQWKMGVSPRWDSLKVGSYLGFLGCMGFTTIKPTFFEMFVQRFYANLRYDVLLVNIACIILPYCILPSHKVLILIIYSYSCICLQKNETTIRCLKVQERCTIRCILHYHVSRFCSNFVQHGNWNPAFSRRGASSFMAHVSLLRLFLASRGDVFASPLCKKMDLQNARVEV